MASLLRQFDWSERGVGDKALGIVCGHHTCSGLKNAVWNKKSTTWSRLPLFISSLQVVELSLLFPGEKFVDFRLHPCVGYDDFRQQSRLCVG
jgi:hypothetical protein